MDDNVVLVNARNCTLGVSAAAGIGLVLIAFASILGVQVTAQQQTTLADAHDAAIIAINLAATTVQHNNNRIQQHQTEWCWMKRPIQTG